jgi:hypothetical protein
LECYHISLIQAQHVEREGGFIGEQNGGSAHGSAEVLYRLHATRLKCLLSAVDNLHEDRDAAELEALRLTEKYWFTTPRSESTDIRARVWAVLCDSVAAFAQCRADHSFFHRSVYRHAQALMWAPILFDPVGGRAAGSLGAVPLDWAFKLRGFNYSMNAASSALLIISSLFEKRRNQLCAVWVTNSGSATTLQLLNNSIRKYDSLRGKYVSAYIDTLCSCHKREELASFLRWIYSTARDLPSHFAASAGTDNGMPKQSHTLDDICKLSHSTTSHHFLTSVKRQANNALASVVTRELNGQCEVGELTSVQVLVKTAYACFLRLNCSVDDFITRSRFTTCFRDPIEIRSIVDVLIATHGKIDSVTSPTTKTLLNWSGDDHRASMIRAMVQACKETFPALTGSYCSIKPNRTRRMKRTASNMDKDPVEDDDNEDDASYHESGINDGKKFNRLGPSYEAKVPAGLIAGDTFTAVVNTKGGVKKVRLTVPEGEPSTLQFSLLVSPNVQQRARNIPAEENSEND